MKNLFMLLGILMSLMSCGKSHDIQIIIKDYNGKTSQSFVLNSKDLIISNNDKKSDKLLVKDINLADSIIFVVCERLILFGDDSVSNCISVFPYKHKGDGCQMYSKPYLWIKYADNSFSSSPKFSFNGIAGDYNRNIEVTNSLNPKIKGEIIRLNKICPTERPVVIYTNVRTGETTDAAGFQEKLKGLAKEKKKK